MTAPKTKRNQPGFSQLGVWIRSSVMRQLQVAAEAEERTQREVLEDALVEYFKKPRAADASTKPSAT